MWGLLTDPLAPVVSSSTPLALIAVLGAVPPEFLQPSARRVDSSKPICRVTVQLELRVAWKSFSLSQHCGPGSCLKKGSYACLGRGSLASVGNKAIGKQATFQ